MFYNSEHAFGKSQHVAQDYMDSSLTGAKLIKKMRFKTKLPVRHKGQWRTDIKCWEIAWKLHYAKSRSVTFFKCPRKCKSTEKYQLFVTFKCNCVSAAIMEHHTVTALLKFTLGACDMGHETDVRQYETRAYVELVNWEVFSIREHRRFYCMHHIIELLLP